jgi:hypothetical protein
MITNKLNTYIGWMAFVCFWITFILGTVVKIHGLVIVPLLIVFLIIQIVGHWFPGIIYIPITFLGMKSERLFLENIKEGDEFITDFGVRYIVILKKENLIALGCSAEAVSIPIDKFVPFLKDNGVSKYNNKPLKFDPLW